MSIAPQSSPRIPPSTLALRLRISREWRGIEQIEMAEAIDVSRATVSNYERGVTSPRRLQINAWAVTCDVDVDWLKTGEIPAAEDHGPDSDGGGTLQSPRKITVRLLRSGRDYLHSPLEIVEPLEQAA